MKKSTAIVLLAVALLLIAAGIFLGVTEGFGARRTENYGDFSDCTEIRASTDDLDLCLYLASGDRLEVDVYNTDRVQLDSVNGVLTITQRPETFRDRWFRLFRRDKAQVVVWVPEGQLRSVTAEVGSGSFAANDLPAETASLNVTAGSGDVSLYSSAFAGITASASSGTVFTGDLTVGEDLSVKVSSGSISLSETRARRVELNASSGGVWLGTMDAEEELTIKTSSGEVSLSQAQAGQLQIRTTSGDVWAETIRSTGSIVVSSTSGGVSLTVPESPELQIESTSGDVWCVLPGRHEDYAITASTGSGRVSGVHSGHGNEAKIVTVTTTSGDISLDYAG